MQLIHKRFYALINCERLISTQRQKIQSNTILYKLYKYILSDSTFDLLNTMDLCSLLAGKKQVSSAGNLANKETIFTRGCAV